MTCRKRNYVKEPSGGDDEQDTTPYNTDSVTACTHATDAIISYVHGNNRKE